jgi:hypothetical protein
MKKIRLPGTVSINGTGVVFYIPKEHFEGIRNLVGEDVKITKPIKSVGIVSEKGSSGRISFRKKDIGTLEIKDKVELEIEKLFD